MSQLQSLPWSVVDWAEQPLTMRAVRCSEALMVAAGTAQAEGGRAHLVRMGKAAKCCYLLAGVKCRQDVRYSSGMAAVPGERYRHLLAINIWRPKQASHFSVTGAGKFLVSIFLQHGSA